MSDQPIIAEARQFKTEPDWYVLITWPGGRQERVNSFDSEAKAKAWIEDGATEWIRNTRRAGDGVT